MINTIQTLKTTGKHFITFVKMANYMTRKSKHKSNRKKFIKSFVLKTFFMINTIQTLKMTSENFIFF